MLIQSVLLATCLAFLHIADSAPIEKEKIEPVNLHYLCIYQKLVGKDPQGSPILLIHGLSSSMKDWDGIYELLAYKTKRRVCMVDLRNHGESPWHNNTDIESMTVDIENFLNRQKIEKVNIIGHSLGGKIAVHFSLKNPERVDSVVIEDMRPNNVTPLAYNMVKSFITFAKQAITQIPVGSTEDEARQYLLEFLKNMLKKVGSNERPSRRTAKSFAIREVDGKWQWKFNIDVVEEAFKNTDMLTESKGLYKGPAMFIYGTESPFDVGGDKDNIMKLFPNAELVPVKGAGHGIHGYSPQFDDEVLRFLDNVK